MGKGSRLLTLVIALGTLSAVLLGSGAYAGSTGVVPDDPQNNQADFRDGSKPACDTLNSPVPQNRLIVSYNCRPEVNLTSWLFEGTLAPAGLSNTPAGINVLHAQWNVSGTIPNESIPPAQVPRDFGGVSYYMYFQNPVWQDARQITGDLVDCRRYSHFGPWLSGNTEYFLLFWTIRLIPDTQGNPAWNVIYGWGQFDPVGNVNYLTTADPPLDRPLQTRCVNNVPTPGFTDPGSQVSFTVSGSTLDLYVPMRFHEYLGAPTYLPRDTVIAQPGDQIRGVQPASFIRLNVYGTPAISVGGTQVLGPSGLAFIYRQDWSPWAAFDLGIFTPQTAALNGPSCPYFTVPLLLGVTTYVQTLEGPEGQDNDLQFNPLFGAPDGLDHYDSSQLQGTTQNQLRQQNHLGPTACNINVPTAAHFVPSAGLSFTA